MTQNMQTPGRTPPSPYDPNIDSSFGMHDGEKSDLQARRARILAEARRLIVDQRFTGFTVKRLSEICEISPQSLYNIYGSKWEIIASSINDYSEMMYTICQNRHDGILEYAEIFAMSCENHPEFFSRILPNTYFYAHAPIVYEKTQSHGIDIIGRLLLVMRHKGSIRSDIDIRLAASVVSTLISETLLVWSRGAIATMDLPDQMRSRINLILDGVR